MENTNRIKILLSNFSYTFSSNILTMLVSILTVLLLPKIIGVTDYGFWQLYLLYVSYVAVIQMGWCDGIYLRYGGINYNKLNKSLLSSQFWYLIIFYLILSAISMVFLINTFNDSSKIIIISFAFLSGLFTTPRGFLFYLLQATNRIKEFAIISIVDRIMFIIILSIMLLLNFRSFEVLIVADLVAQLVSLILTTFICKDLLLTKFSPVKDSLIEAYRNIDAGFKLMLANFASMLIIGVTRLSIEYKWGIEVFGKVSLTLNISNFFLIFIRAISIIIFPMLRNTPEDKLQHYYLIMRNFLMIPLLSTLSFYIPIKIVLVQWLPQYAESLKYMALLLPIILYECKVSMLINTYLKNLRKEKMILIINICYMAISCITAYIAIFKFENLTLSIVSILIVLALRSITAEMYISKLLKINVIKDNLLELLLTFIFVFFSWFFDSWLSMLAYLLMYIIYIYIKKEDIKYMYSSIKSLKN